MKSNMAAIIAAVPVRPACVKAAILCSSSSLVCSGVVAAAAATTAVSHSTIGTAWRTSDHPFMRHQGASLAIDRAIHLRSAVSPSCGLRPRSSTATSTLLFRRLFSELSDERQSRKPANGPEKPDLHHSQNVQQHNSDKPTPPEEASPTKPIIGRSLDVARERTKAVSEKVRSSLSNITPRENIYNLPNLLTVSRLFAAPTTAYLLLHDHHKWALALFAYAGLTDLVDGWLARKWKLQTVAGSVIDPMADKTLMIILTVTLAVKGALPAYLATLILGRDASLALAALYYRYASLPAPKTFVRYWDFSLPSAEVHPTTVSKYNTFLPSSLIGATLALPVVFTAAIDAPQTSSWSSLATTDAQNNVRSAMTYFQYLVAATTVWSGLSYAVLKNAVTILGSNEALKVRQGARGRAIIGVTFGSVVLLAAWIAQTVDEEKVMIAVTSSAPNQELEEENQGPAR